MQRDLHLAGMAMFPGWLLSTSVSEASSFPEAAPAGGATPDMALKASPDIPLQACNESRWVHCCLSQHYRQPCRQLATDYAGGTACWYHA